MGRDLDRMIDAALVETGREHRRALLFWRWGGRLIVPVLLVAVLLGAAGFGLVKLWSWFSGALRGIGLPALPAALPALPALLGVLALLGLLLWGVRVATRGPQEAARRRARRL
jgi:hypothetical protein